MKSDETAKFGLARAESRLHSVAVAVCKKPSAIRMEYNAGNDEKHLKYLWPF